MSNKELTEARHIAQGEDLEWQAKVFHEEMDKLGVPRHDGEDFYSLYGRANLARAALAAQPVAQAPEGWKLVPVEPCDLLLNSFLAGYGARGGSFNAMHLRDRARRGYRQMLEAVDLAFERGIYPIKGSGND